MKGYYVHFDARRWIGVSKKIEMQMQEFGKIFDMQEIEAAQNQRSVLRKLWDINPFAMSCKYNLDEVYGKIKNPDFLYVRAICSDNQYISFFKTIKQSWPNCKLLVEMPTYPYDKAVQRLLYPRDLISRKKYSRYVDRIVTYSQDKEIFGCPTIPIMNGVIVDEIKPLTREKADTKINLLGVAMMQVYHGYERIIEGMADYKRAGGASIMVHLVGDGPEKERYVRLSEKLEVTDTVKFYPYLRGEELDRIYETADMTLNNFGGYKQDVYLSSALKSRESLAKGLPLVTACKVDVCEKVPFPYICEFPNDNSKIDMFRIETFYRSIMKNKTKLILVDEIRKYARDNLDMSQTLKPVFDYIRSEGMEK